MINLLCKIMLILVYAFIILTYYRYMLNTDYKAKKLIPSVFLAGFCGTLLYFAVSQLLLNNPGIAILSALGAFGFACCITLISKATPSVGAVFSLIFFILFGLTAFIACCTAHFIDYVDFRIDSTDHFFIQFVICLLLFVFTNLAGIIYHGTSKSAAIKHKAILLLIPLSDFLIILILWIYSIDHGNVLFSVVSILTAVIMFVTNVINYIIINSLLTAEEIKDKEIFLEQQLAKQTDGYAKVVASYKKQQSIVHDYNKHFLYIKEGINSGDIDSVKAYLDELDNRISESERKISTGLLPLDAIINNCIERCSSINIPVTTEIKIDKNLLSLDEYCLSIILGNLTDNAIKELSSCDKETSAFLNIEIYMTNSKFIISISNYCSNDKTLLIDPNEDSPDTSIYREHGFGLINTAEAAKKLGGFTNFRMENHVFTATTIIPLDL